MKKITCIFLSLLLLASFAGCAQKDDVEQETEMVDVTVQEETETVTEKPTETTTAPTTTAAPETTTEAPKNGEAIQGIIDTLESQTFYMAGVMHLNGGETIDAKMTCEGENYRMEMVSSQMNMTLIYLDSLPYVVNNSTNTYAVIDQAAIDSLDQVLNSFSAYGVTFNSSDIADMKNMMSNFDQNLDYSQYINDGEYSEYDAKIDGVEYLCSVYETEYGTIRIYTQEGNLKMIDIFDADGLRQLHFVISAFIPQVLTPISINGLTQTASILNLFSIA